MKVLMLGWEFPPFFAGGLGIVCYELTKAFSTFNDLEVTYVMPFGPSDMKSPFVKLMAAKRKVPHINVYTVNSIISAYMSYQEYSDKYSKLVKNSDSNDSLYSSNLYEEVELFSKRVVELSKELDFDVIHAHDWLTFPAGVALSKLTGKPLVLHIHNTVYDRYLCEVEYEKQIEKMGFDNCNLIIAISDYVKNTVLNNYNINPNKIRVIHNGGISDLETGFTSKTETNEKVVLFAGRLTKQKGPDYFLRAARRVIDVEPNTKFIIAGDGDMKTSMMQLASDLGIQDRVYFHGKYSREDAKRFFARADLFVMPSVSEPFGIVPLEAISKGTPTIISKQSGISEVLENTFKVDFWDIDEMSSKIVSILRYKPLREHMRKLAFDEFEKFNWDEPARKVYEVYKEVM